MVGTLGRGAEERIRGAATRFGRFCIGWKSGDLLGRKPAHRVLTCVPWRPKTVYRNSNLGWAQACAVWAPY